ncbi:MAG: hypothetical protein ACUVQ0_04060 [Thermoproteota archaeon]
MHITLDNVLAFLVLILIMITFMSYIIPTAYLSFTTVKEHQLEEVAQTIMDRILLSPGYPEDWGKLPLEKIVEMMVNKKQEPPLSFGLQKAGGKPYELDINKVLRITNSGEEQLPEYLQVSPRDIARLLGLGDEYGFSIMLKPALNIGVEVTGTYNITGKRKVPSRVEVEVETHEGRPAIGANVTGLYLINIIKKKGGDFESKLRFIFKTRSVRYDGKVSLDFLDFLEGMNPGDWVKSVSFLTVYADYHGIRSASSFTLDTEEVPVKAFSLGDSIIVLADYEDGIEIIPNAAAHIGRAATSVDPPYNVYPNPLHTEANGGAPWVINYGSKYYHVYDALSPIDDDVTYVILPVRYLGSSYYGVPVLRPPPELICRFGMATGNIKTSVLRRIVKIGSFHYVFELMVWRWGERGFD